MRTSRTTPTKLATAPTPGPLERILVSAPTSKSSLCTEIFISAAGHRGKEGDLVAAVDARRGLDHVLVERGPDEFLFRECRSIGSAARPQVRAQRVNRRLHRGHLKL